MSSCEIHFLHGFLGSPKDWEQVVSFVKGRQNISYFLHDIKEDIKNFDDLSFSSWAQAFERKYQQRDCERLFVGYSLGGRLLMHLRPRPRDRFVLIGANPGVIEDRQQRLKWDQEWTKKSQTLTQREWLFQWNNQEIFSQDKVRPIRDMSEEDFKIHILTLNSFSLAKQEARFDLLKDYKDQFFWVYGEKDLKYKSISKSVEEVLGPTHVIEVANAGHGVLFDAPSALASIVNGVIENDF